MPLEAPRLDTRTFEELFNLARLRIPRYTPEWTDFNESDPGITLVQLFAWLTEMMLYQMNRVPERNYIKFLQLLNMELRPAQAAQAYLTFKAQPGADVQPVRAGAQFGAQSPESGELLIFEAEYGLDLIRVPLVAVQVSDGTAFTQFTGNNEAQNTPYPPLGWVPQVNSALYLGFEPTDPPAVGRPFPQQIRLRVFLPESAQAGVAQRCETQERRPGFTRESHPWLEPSVKAVREAVLESFVPADRRDVAEEELREALAEVMGWRVGPQAGAGLELIWEYRAQQNLARWRQLNVFEDTTNNLTQEGDILLEGPAELEPTQVGKEKKLHYWLRCRLVAGSYPAGRVPQIDFVRPNTVEAHNLSTVREEVLGTSEGRPDQTFTLARTPVQPTSLELVTELDDETTTWERVDDFLASEAEHAHYVLNPTSGEMQFGDGNRGLIPTLGSMIVARKYRYGGGDAGNVDRHMINIPLTGLVGVESVTNERPAVGGRDEQDIEDLMDKAPRVLRSRNRAVTGEDFAALAEQAGSVARATAIPLAHPDHPGVDVPGAITVVIVPDTKDMPPQPSSDLIRRVCDYLGKQRLLTTEVYVKGPAYREIRVEARVAAKPYAAFGAVNEAIIEAINGHLNPLGRRPRPTTDNGSDGSATPSNATVDWEWEFGRDFYPTRLFNVIQDVEDVDAVTKLNVFVNGRPHEDITKPIAIPPDGLLYGAANHLIVVEPIVDR